MTYPPKKMEGLTAYRDPIAPYKRDYSTWNCACPHSNHTKTAPRCYQHQRADYRAEWHTIGYQSAYIVPESPGNIKSRAFLCLETGGLYNG